MKRLQNFSMAIVLMFFLGVVPRLEAQVSVNTSGAAANPKSMLDISSTDKGLLIPRMTTTQLNTFAAGLDTGEKGMLVFDTDQNRFYLWDGASLVEVKSGNIDKLQDSNNDSEIYLFSQYGEDMAVIKIQNNDYFKFKAGRMEFVNNGESVFIGNTAGMDDNHDDNKNVFVGSYSGRHNTTGFYNLATGYGSLKNNLSGYRNVALGYWAMLANSSGSNNTAVGESSLKFADSSSYNTAIGSSSLLTLHNGSSNTAVGTSSLYYLASGDDNTIVGEAAGSHVDTGNANVMIGYSSGAGTSAHSASGNIFLGYMSGYNESGSNKLYIENSSSSTPLIGGDFSADEVYINGTMRISGGSPAQGKFLKTDDSGNATWDSISLSNINNVIENDTNVFIGFGAGTRNSGNSYSVGIGRYASANNQTGVRNVAVGSSALYSNVSSSDNTSVGYSSALNSTGSENTAIGSKSLSNNSGSRNVAIGLLSLNNNAGGYENVGIGNYNSYYNQNGSGNTTIGYMSGFGNSLHSKSGNVFIGYKSGYYETGDNKLYIENSDTTAPLIGGDFATDEVYINGIIKITGGNPANGKILTSDASGTASWQENTGASELNELSDAASDGSSVFVGDSSGYSDDGSANKNTGLGVYALYSNTFGNINTAIGYGSLRNTTSATSNTAVGYETLQYDTTGSNNTGVGTYALLFTNAPDNTGIGYMALRNNREGQKNTAIGSGAMVGNHSGIENVAVGYEALNSNSSGDYNTALGRRSLSGNSGGTQNVAVGYNAATSGDHTQCTFLGASANNSSSTARTNSTAIGFEATIYGSYMVRIGNSSVSSIGGYADWTNISDKRFKYNVKEDVPGLDFIMKLRPVTYQLDLQKINKHLGIKNDPNNLNAAKQQMLQSGFIAQEVEKTASDIGYEFSGVDAPQDKDGEYGLRYAQFVVPLVKAVQELNQKNEQLLEENEALKARLDKIEQQLGIKE